jgi:hypothetical protein
MSIPNFRNGIINILVLAFTFSLNAATTSSPVVSYFHCVMPAYLKPWGDGLAGRRLKRAMNGCCNTGTWMTRCELSNVYFLSCLVTRAPYYSFLILRPKLQHGVKMTSPRFISTTSTGCSGAASCRRYVRSFRDYVESSND